MGSFCPLGGGAGRPTRGYRPGGVQDASGNMRTAATAGRKLRTDNDCWEDALGTLFHSAMTYRRLFAAACLASLYVHAPVARADMPIPARLDFKRDGAAILAYNCYACHG